MYKPALPFTSRHGRPLSATTRPRPHSPPAPPARHTPAPAPTAPSRPPPRPAARPALPPPAPACTSFSAVFSCPVLLSAALGLLRDLFGDHRAEPRKRHR